MRECASVVCYSLSVASVTVPPMAASIIRVFVVSSEEWPLSSALCGRVGEQSAPNEQQEQRHYQR